ncbi:flavodoxin family protein [Methanobrevibacter sp.]|uniref:flavodoxin family protein n=1 Tax=Methanobrevibacter sp. TaxID=66852 RepID=UPI003865CF9B
MKYVIINGSPRRKNTWKMVEQAKMNLKGDFEEIHLMKEKIPMCNGCYKCIMEGEEKCPHEDKVKPIVDRMMEADGIIIASPVYAMNVTALLKNFFDHTAYFYHRPDFFTKKALVVVSTAGAGHKKVANYIDETLRHWGVNKVYKIAMACGGKDALETKQIDKVSQKFAADVESGKMHSPKFGDIVFFDVWKAMAVSSDPIKADAEFWHKSDLVNHDFAPEVKLNPLKKLFSKLMFLIMKKVMK